jgi:putative peptidoglycan lipid II flippase
MVNASWLLYGLRARGLYRASPGWPLFLLRLLPANLGLGLWLGWTTQAVDWLAWRSHALLRAGGLGGAIAVGAVIYFGLLWLVGLRPRTFLRRA